MEEANELVRRKQVNDLRAGGNEAFCAGDIPTASKLFSQALQIDTGLDDGSWRKSLSGAYQSARYDEHRNVFDKAGMFHVLNATYQRANENIKENPECVKAYLAKGAVLLLQDKWDEARETYLEGMRSCQGHAALQAVIQKLNKTQRLLQTVPPQFHDIHGSDGSRKLKLLSSGSHHQHNPPINPRSYQPRTHRSSRKFRLQFRKKLSNEPRMVAQKVGSSQKS